MLIAESRKYFPYLNIGMLYMKHAAVSPLATPVVEAIDKFLYLKSYTEIENYKDYLKLIAETKYDIGELINCKPDRIAFVDNTSNGLNILAQGLDWKYADRIILNDLEFPSNVYPFLNLKTYGIEIDFVKSKNGVVFYEDIEKAVTEKTRLLSISYVQFLTGYRADLERIGELCRRKGIIFCVDSIQGLGAVALDVQKCKIDFVANGCQKWLMSLEGLGFIYLSEELQEKITQKYVGWTSVASAWNLLDYKLTLKKNADRFQNGTMSATGITALNAALKFLSSFDFKEIEKVILDNAEYFIGSLNEIGIVPILKNAYRKNLSGIISFKTDKSQIIFDTLLKENIIGAVREGIVRFSPHFYNNREEIDKTIYCLKNLQ
jgi:cysteine desulfurase/selenocysteine lyase